MCEEHAAPDTKNYVGIGASAGGVEALQELFLHMPGDTGASFIVVQHLSPDAVSMMDKILGKSSAMPVQLAQEGMIPLPNHIYLNVPGMTLTIQDEQLHLEPAQNRNQLYMPINLMLHSLATQKDAGIIAVILSGSGSDGALGIGSIKSCKGMVIAQKPTEAQYASMPQSAIATGMVDLVESTALIGDFIQNYLKNPTLYYIGSNDSFAENKELLEDFKQVLNTVSLYSGIDFSSYKENTLLRRIERRIGINKFRGIGEYLDYIISSETEKEILYRDLLIGVTSFFRDGEAFKSLKNNVILPLLKRKKKLRFWSIACSTGEEAYSLAILVFECMEQAHFHGDIKIFATDVDPDAISTAQRGIYPESALAGMPEQLLNKYFDAAEYGYMIKENIRKMIIFAKHNIFRDAPFSRLDLIVCRNMFIYVKTDVQKHTFENFYRLLSDNGYLFLGSSESLGTMEDAFILLDKKWKLYQKNMDYNNNSIYRFPLPDNFSEPESHNDTSLKPPHRMNGSNIFEKILFVLAGPSVLTDGFGKIVQIIQQGGKYLSLQDGQFDSSLHSCFAPELAALLEHILSELRKSGDYQMHKKVTGLSDYPNEALNITVSYFQLNEGPYFLIQITEEPIEKPQQSQILDLRELKDSRIQELEKALGESNWNLQLAVEESESRNEELQAANEELLAANEELQSTNEEMQSVNEELYTINAEYQNKILELTTANADFDNLLLNAEVGALYIDGNMHIRKITPIMLQNTNLLISDLERPVTHINFLDSYKEFIHDVYTVSNERKILEKEVTDENNITWLIRIRPYFENNTNHPGGVLVTMFDITKRLEAAKFELKRLIDSVPGGVLRMHYEDELIIDYANDSFYSMSGYTAEEFKIQFHNRYNRLINPADWALLKDKINVSAAAGEIVKAEYPVPKKNGSVCWHSMQAVIFMEAGQIDLQCIITDISLLKMYEQQLKKERDYYNALYQNLVCGIVQYEKTDRSLRCYTANDEAVKMLGFASLEEFRCQEKQTLPDVSHRNDADKISQKLLSMDKVGECVDFEHRIVRRDGEIRWLSGAAKVITAPDEKILIQSTFMDVTEQKKSEEQLKKERDQYDKLYNMLYHMAVCGIIQVDAHSKKILNINREALKILDEDGSADVEAKIFSSAPQSDSKNLCSIGSLLLSLTEIGQQQHISLSLTKKNGDHISIEGWANWIIDALDQKIVQFTFLDVTERERLKEAEIQLKIATKSNEAKSNFLSKMSHEIRTPMNGIAGMVDSALLTIDDTERVKDCLGKMRRSMDHLQKLINDILDMSRIEKGKMTLEEKPFNLETLLDDIVGEFEFSASQKGIFLRLNKKITHKYVVSDITRMREILGNLIGNSIKFTDSCGKVTLSAEEEPVNETVSNYTFQVKDNGCGISSEDQALIFDLFEQGTGNTLTGNKGSGLGLAISKNLVHMLGGSLNVTSAIGWGSEFCFTIPIKLSHESALETKAPDLSHVSFEGLRVLLAEDNELNAEIAETFLKAYGFDVTVCENGREAFEIFTDSDENYFDLILLDIQMPEMNGYETARNIRSLPKTNASSIPILAMSANAFAEDIAASLEAGMNGHIAKPVNMETLIMTLQRFVGKRQQRRPFHPLSQDTP